VNTFGFRQVDVFSSEPLRGNPVAVVHDADELTDEQMAAFARWTNLSETTFLLAPTTPEADYRLRIFTPGGELPFAGHPTLGSAHAWLQAGGTPKGERLVQECGVGLVALRREDRLAFAAPPLTRTGDVNENTIRAIAKALGIERHEIVQAQWVVNGPEFVALRLADADRVLRLDPSFPALAMVYGVTGVGVAGRYPASAECEVEVRVFLPAMGIDEDPVTGSFNAALAAWQAGAWLSKSYLVSQGSALGRRGRVHVDTDADGTIWVGGDTATTIVGTVAI